MHRKKLKDGTKKYVKGSELIQKKIASEMSMYLWEKM